MGLDSPTLYQLSHPVTGVAVVAAAFHQLDTLIRVTQYVHPHIYMHVQVHNYTVHRLRGLRVRPFSMTQPLHSVFRGCYLPFPENKVCYVMSLPWLKIIPTQQDITTCCTVTQRSNQGKTMTVVAFGLPLSRLFLTSTGKIEVCVLGE